MEHELQAAADEVIGEFDDEVSRSCDFQLRRNLRWDVNFLYTFPWGGLQSVLSLAIEEDYPFVPVRELLKSKMRAQLLANPPELAPQIAE